MSAVVDWRAWLDAPDGDDDVPWFFVGEPTPIEGVVWCCSLWAVCVALCERFGVSPEGMHVAFHRAAEAFAYVPADASPREEADAALDAADAALEELLA